MAELNGRTAFVTGASRGIGAAVCRQLAAAGANVAAASRSGGEFRCDVRDREQVERAVASAAERFGGIDILVNNAGVGSYGSLLDLDMGEVEEMIDVNLKGTIYATRAALPHLFESDAADIVNVASVAGLRGLPNETIYCASKFGQVGFLRALDHEVRERGVRCTNVCPGGVATDFALGRGRPEEVLEGMMSSDDVAETVMHVLTRPRGHRMLTVSLRPVGEESTG